MQAVIQKLKEQEKELEQLHQREKERAQQTERLSEAVTSNMPSGLLLVNSSGLISSANPAAEAALEIRSLPYRKYTEVFGPESRVARMIEGCLADGITFRREEVEYTTPSRELRQLGVTISPITNKPGEVSGALCLLSDLTELAGLQKQIQMKESLAALGELSAGIAHEFKNALATISGYAQMIRSESEKGDVWENADSDFASDARDHACGDGVLEICAPIKFGGRRRATRVYGRAIGHGNSRRASGCKRNGGR